MELSESLLLDWLEVGDVPPNNLPKWGDEVSVSSHELRLPLLSGFQLLLLLFAPVHALGCFPSPLPLESEFLPFFTA